jgi:hypothetical protein
VIEHRADGPLPLAKRALDDAVSAICDPIPRWVDGELRWADPLYVQLRIELAGNKPTQRSQVVRAILPCRVDILALLIEVDRAVITWTRPDGKGDTPERLRALAARGWRPQDVGLIEAHVAGLWRWQSTGTQLLTPAVRLPLSEPCPRGGARWAYHDHDGEQTHTRALTVSEDGCACAACGAYWTPDQFGWLARLFGCESAILLPIGIVVCPRGARLTIRRGAPVPARGDSQAPRMSAMPLHDWIKTRRDDIPARRGKP